MMGYGILKVSFLNFIAPNSFLDNFCIQIIFMCEVGKCPEHSGSESLPLLRHFRDPMESQSSPRNVKNFTKKSETVTLSQQVNLTRSSNAPPPPPLHTRIFQKLGLRFLRKNLAHLCQYFALLQCITFPTDRKQTKCNSIVFITFQHHIYRRNFDNSRILKKNLRGNDFFPIQILICLRYKHYMTGQTVITMDIEILL